MITATRIAALYDIHGNLPALEAVLDTLTHETVDLIVVGGDVFPGPMASECVALLRSLSTPICWVMGNGDREMLAARRGERSATVPDAAVPALQWCAAQLSDDQAAHIAHWPTTQRIAVSGLGEVLFCHATPHSDAEIVTALTDADTVAELFGDTDAVTVVCGHTHMQFDRQIDTLRVVNAGSVGMPFGTPGAHWLMMSQHIDLRYTPYHLADAAQRLRASAYPHADRFARASVLEPPSAVTMLAQFHASQLVPA